MKPLRLVILWLWCFACMAFAERSLTLAWTANPASDLVTGYIVTVDGVRQPPVTGTTAQVTIPDARTSVAVIAVNLGGESAPSAPLAIPASPANPAGVRVTAIMRTTISTP